MTQLPDMPTQEQIASWLVASGRPERWAKTLCGLPGKYIGPIVNIAATVHTHPYVVMATAASYSKDREFITAIRAHLGRDTS